MDARTRIDSNLSVLLEWLSEERVARSPASFEPLREEIESWLRKLRQALLDHDLDAAEQQLLELAERHHIRTIMRDLKSRVRNLPSSFGDVRSDDESRERGGWSRTDARGWDEGPIRGEGLRADTLRGEGLRGDTLRSDMLRSETLRGELGTAEHSGGVFGKLWRLVASAPPPIKTYPQLELPEIVTVKTTFQIYVTARPTPAANTSGATPVELPRTQDRPVDLEVTLLLDKEGGFEAHGATEGVLRVATNGSAARLEFELFAKRPGIHALDVVLRRDGVECARLHRDVVVQEAAPTTDPPVNDSANRVVITSAGLYTGASFLGLVLRVDLVSSDTTRRIYRMTLGGSAWDGPVLTETPDPLPGNMQTLIADFCRLLPKDRALSQQESRELRLRNHGIDLANRLLPPAIAEALADRRFLAGTPLHIESDDAWIPWETLWLGNPHNPEPGGAFLGEHFAITRWLRTANAQEKVAQSSALPVLIFPLDSGLNEEPERRALQALRGQPPRELRKLLDVQQLLSGQASIGILHFVCHGASTRDAVLPEALKMEAAEVLRTSDVVRPARGKTGPLFGALVFINACQAGIVETSLWDHNGWADMFLRAGAGAVLAPSWTVTDNGAARFATEFYKLAGSGLSLGEAARRSRLSSTNSGSADRLGYAVYAAPTARLSM